MQILCTVDIRTRELYLEDVTIAAFDHLVDDVLFVIEPIDGFQLETSTIKIAAVGPLGEPHDYEIDPSTVTVDEETGNINFIWSIPVGVTAMPLTTFKISDTKKITFAVCAEIVSGDNLVKAWHSDDGTIKVKAHLEPESGGGEDPSETATNAQKIAQLQTDVAVINTQVGALANGSPTPVETIAEMTDESAVYLYTGSETGYTAGNWYYYDGTEWTSGGTYGGAVTSTTFNQRGVPADDFAVGEALAEKADSSDVTALDTRVTAVEGDVDALDGKISGITQVGTQLFDKDNADIVHLIPSNGIASASANGTSIIVPVSPSANDSYITVHRDIITSRFIVATFAEYPETGVSYITQVNNSYVSAITIGVDTSVKYVMIYCHLATADTSVTVEEVADGLMVQYGDSYTGYKEYALSVKIPDDYITPDMFNSDVSNYVKSQAIDDNVSELVNGNMQDARTSSDITLTWTEGAYYNFTTGEITELSGRAYSQKIPCKSGDTILVKNNKGQTVFWKTDGSYLSYVSNNQDGYALRTAPENAGFFAFNNSDSSIRATGATHYSSESELIEIVQDAPARLIYDTSAFTQGKYVSTANGSVSDLSATWWCAIALPCKPSHKYRTEGQTQVVFYDGSMTFISSILPNNSASYTGVAVEMDFITPSNCAYMSINTTNAHEKVFDIEAYTIVGNIVNPQKLEGLGVVCFGDSITGNYGFGDNIPYQIEKITGAKTYNCGFGGCRMEMINNDFQHTNPFSMCGIVDALQAAKNGDSTAWDEHDTYAESISKMVLLRLQILKAIDWSKVNIVTIAYGTNEGGYPQDDEQNPLNPYTYGGATRYAVSKLLTMYPHLRIVLLTPIYRFYTSEGVDSDTHTHPTYGGKLTDNVDTLISVGSELKVPCIDLYHSLGINIYNYTSYFGDDDEVYDGTHINTFGRKTYGRRLAGELNRLF